MVGALGTKLGMGQPALSRPRARLRREGLLAARRDRAHIRHRLASPEAERVLATLLDLYCR